MERFRGVTRFVRNTVLVTGLVVTPIGITSEVANTAPRFSQEATADQVSPIQPDDATDQNPETRDGISSDPNTGYNQGFEQDYQRNLLHPDPKQVLADMRNELPAHDKDVDLIYDYENNSYVISIHGDGSLARVELTAFMAKHGLTIDEFLQNAKVRVGQ